MNLWLSVPLIFLFFVAALLTPASSGVLDESLFAEVPFKEAVLLLKDGRTEKAYKLLSSEKMKYKGTVWEPRVNFLHGTVAASLGHYAECAKSLREVGQAAFLPDYSYLYLSRCLAGEKKYEEAISSLKEITEKHIFSTQIEPATYELAQSLLLSGNVQKGLKVTEFFIRKFPKSKRIPDAYMEAGKALEKLKRPVDAYEPYRTLYYHYPENPLADVALQRTIAIRKNKSLKIRSTPLYLRKLRVKLLIKKRRYRDAIKEIKRVVKLLKGTTEFQRMQISLSEALRRVGNKKEAARVLERFLKKFPESRMSAKARYLLGKIYWNTGSPEKALHLMTAIVRKYPKTGWAARALYVSGRIYEERGNFSLATKKYNRVVHAYSKSSLKDDAVWRTGWIYYNSSKYEKMIALFKEVLAETPEGPMKNQLLYWIARGYEKTGNTEAALFNYETVTSFPYSYYGAMAHTRVLKLNGEKKVKESSGGSGIKKQSFASNGLYERVKKALKPAKERYREHLIKGLELARLGLFEYAELEFAAGGPALKGSIEKNMLSGDLFEMANNFNKAYQIRDQVLNRMSEARVEKMPFVFWKPFFPLSYWNNIERFSKKEGVDPFLVLSIIKQESVYDPMALSAANASGLMQIMPKTGRRLYQQVFNKAGFHREFLFNPKINLQLGITYLSGLLSTYKSDLVLAIATYNAGPKPVKRWAARYAGLPQDEFVEKIPYPETRKYVKKVLKNYVNYKELYSYQ